MAGIVVVGSIDYFESEERVGRAMEDFVNSTATAASDSVDPMEVGKVDVLVLEGGGGWERERNGDLGLG